MTSSKRPSPSTKLYYDKLMALLQLTASEKVHLEVQALS